MVLGVLEFILILIVAYSTIAGAYQLMLALSYYITTAPGLVSTEKEKRFAILVPAHNEELLIADFCINVLNINYPKDLYDVFIIADNCTDRTVEICSQYPVSILIRNDTSKTGKGYALEWALENIDIDQYDAVMVLDADTHADEHILTSLESMLASGEVAIQCYIEVPNRNETWFTRLIYLSRTINDVFYHYAKYKLGLSAYLMGTGMCFSTDLLKNMKWNAFTLSEDWEYYAKLIERGYKIAFAKEAVVLQQESSTLKQATSQRLRWASGRFYVVKSLGIRLLLKGIRARNIVMADASLALLLPNWSLQVNLIVLSLIILIFMPHSFLIYALTIITLLLLLIQCVIVLMGILRSDDPMLTLKAVALAPIFLIWKFMIDILCVTNIYKGDKWIRTKRHKPKT